MTNKVSPSERLTEWERIELCGVLAGYNAINNLHINDYLARGHLSPLAQTTLDSIIETRDLVEHLLEKLRG